MLKHANYKVVSHDGKYEHKIHYRAFTVDLLNYIYVCFSKHPLTQVLLLVNQAL